MNNEDYAEKIVDEVAQDMKRIKQEALKILHDFEQDPSLIK